jgi:hypothetical protein
MQSTAPAPAVFLQQESLGSIHGEARRDDEVGAAAQQLQTALEANLLSAASDKRIPGAKESMLRVRGCGSTAGI